MIRRPVPRRTLIDVDPATNVTNVYCMECRCLVAWVSQRMQIEQPGRARAMLSSHHINDRECNIARSQAHD